MGPKLMKPRPRDIFLFDSLGIEFLEAFFYDARAEYIDSPVRPLPLAQIFKSRDHCFKLKISNFCIFVHSIETIFVYF